MSFDFYTKWWIKNKKEIEELRQFDQFVVNTTKMTKARDLATHLAGGMFARYSLLVQKIDDCFDQMAQPQKRATVRKLMESAVMRLNELKEELVKIDISEYHYIDSSLIELKLIPHSVEILHPCLFYDRPWEIEDMWTKIKAGEVIYVPPPPPTPTESEVLEGLEALEEGPEKPPETEAKDAKKPKTKNLPIGPVLTAEELEELERKHLRTKYINIIQTHERARQARLYFKELYQKVKTRKEQQPGKKPDEPPDPIIQNNAAVVLQKHFRGFSDRKYLKRREKERRFLIGMSEPHWKDKSAYETYQKNLETRRALRERRAREYIDANLAEKARILRVIAPGLMEDIGDEIREWFHHWYDNVRNFDKYPEPEVGGSILIVRGETMTPQQWLDEVERKRRERELNKGKGIDKAKLKEMKAKAKAAEKAKKKKEAEMKKKAEAMEKKKALQEGFVFKLKTSAAAEERLENGFEEYRKLWDERNDFDNPEERHYMDLINEEKCYEMQLEVRPIVDEMMRIELDLLNEALARDRNKKPKKKPKAKKKKKKKDKKAKKDLTANRTIEDIFQELVNEGIIHTYDTARLEDYKGDFSYNAFDRRMQDFDPPATLGDVRQAVLLNCIQPLGVSEMVRPRSVLIAGPSKTGKHLLANAIFTETRCVLFDLSPKVLAGKYVGKKNMNMLVHLINKMSRILQPSIIFIDGGEKPFYKKVPKEEKALEPKKMGKSLFKQIIKPIKPEDRVLVLGITNQPWAGKAAALKKAFERIIYIPKPDYNSIFHYWRELLMPYQNVHREFDCSALTKVTIGYPLPCLKAAVERVFTPTRIIQLSYQPLRQRELYEAILNNRECQKTNEKDLAKFEKWYKGTKLGKERAQYIAMAAKLREDAEKKKKK